MTDRLRIVLIVGIVIYFLIVFRLLKHKKLSLKYSLLWIGIGAAMSTLVIIPDLLVCMSHFFGIVDTMNGLFTFAIGFILILLMALTSIVSKQSDKIRILTQDIALLEKKVRELEKSRKNKDEDGIA